MKFTTYEQFKNATEDELLDICIDDYTDEEAINLSLWFMRLKQEDAFEHLGVLDNLTKEEVIWLGLNNKYILNKVISESAEEFNIDGKIIKGREIITRDKYSIIQEDNTNNFYKIEK